MRLGSFLKSAALLGAILLPTGAIAATAIATTDVNLRAGPSTGYPAVNVVGAGNDVEVFGCLSNRSWCDVDYYGQRGWMSSNYLAFVDDGRRYTGARVVERIGAPVVSFSVGNYWDRHYRGRPFYRDRERYGRPDFDRPSRREYREERRDRREDRYDRRVDRREFRDDRREDRREFRQERRDDRREFRDDRRRFEQPQYQPGDRRYDPSFEYNENRAND